MTVSNPISEQKRIIENFLKDVNLEKLLVQLAEYVVLFNPTKEELNIIIEKIANEYFKK